MKPKVKRIIGNICYPLAVVLLIFGVWAAAAYAKGVTLSFPRPRRLFTSCSLTCRLRFSGALSQILCGVPFTVFSFPLRWGSRSRSFRGFPKRRTGSSAADGGRARGTHDGDHLYPLSSGFRVRSRPWSSRSSSSVHAVFRVSFRHFVRRSETARDEQSVRGKKAGYAVETVRAERGARAL